MDPDAVAALAHAALLDLRADEARAITAALEPLLARLHALPPGTAEAAPAGCGRPTTGAPGLRADVPGPTLPRAAALGGVPSVTATGLVQVGATPGPDVSAASRRQGSS